MPYSAGTTAAGRRCGLTTQPTAAAPVAATASRAGQAIAGPLDRARGESHIGDLRRLELAKADPLSGADVGADGCRPRLELTKAAPAVSGIGRSASRGGRVGLPNGRRTADLARS